jgi:3-oxoacyl-[acyl-carrier protein] reductase
MNLKNKTILVTGSSSGIGRAIAIACAQKQATVLIHYRKNDIGAKETLLEVKKSSDGQIYQTDLSNPEAVKDLFTQLSKDHKTLDCLVNNAGEYQPGSHDDLSLWQSQFANIFYSQVYATLEFLKMKGSGNLRKVVNISSIYGLSDMGNAGGPQYSAAKAAVNSFTCTLAKKYAPSVLVNAIAPGYTLTPGWDGTSQSDLKASADLTKIGRFVAPEEIATMAIELLTNDGITGEIIRVDGGLHLTNL